MSAPRPASASSVSLPPELQAALPLLDTLHEHYLIADSDRRILYANQTFAQACGVSSGTELAGRRFGDAVRCVHAVESPNGCGSTPACQLCGGLRSQQAALAGESAYDECHVLRADGHALDLRLRASPWQVGAQRLILLSAIDTAPEQRRRAMERLFFHDVRNTTGGIVGFSEFLAQEENTSADSERRTLAETVARLARRLLDEIDAQACLSAAESGELQAHAQLCEPGTFLDVMRDLYLHHPATQGRAIQLSPDPTMPILQTDGVLLSRVVGNLLKNALEASRSGETVTLGCRQLGDTSEFFVHNPGEIPPAVQLQIFQRSFSTKGPSRGLGAYGAHLIGEGVLGGRVGFSSSAADGTVFWIRLPAEAPAPA